MAIDPNIPPALSGIETLYPQYKQPTPEEFQTYYEQMGGFPGLAPTDYSKELQESKDLGKLQFALSLMARGFGSMGATPRVGEMGISTVGRELLAPVAADVMPIAQRLYDDRLKFKLAEKQEKANLTLATLGRMDTAQQYDQARGLAIADKVMDWRIAQINAGELNLGDKVYLLMKDGRPVLRNADDPASLTQVRIGEKLGNIYDIHSKTDRELGEGESILALSDYLSSQEKGMGDPDFRGFYASVLTGFPKIQREIGEEARGFVYDHIRARERKFPFSPWDDRYLTDDQYKIAEKSLMDLAFGVFKGHKPGAQVSAKKPLETSILWHNTTLEDIFGEQVEVKADGQPEVKLQA